jgi:flagellar motor switch protein FliM
VLSSQEIDELLAAINAGDTEPEKSDFKTVSGTRKIKIYDFKRQDKFTKEQIRSISIIHEIFSRDLTATLSDYFRKTIHVHTAFVDQLTYKEFIRTIPSPTTMAILEMTPLKGYGIIEIDPSMTHAMINRLFGGEGDGVKIQHELTSLEMKIMEDVINDNFLMPLHDAWNKIFDMKPALKKIDTEPHLCQIVPSSEMVILVGFECKFGNVEGIINLCLPYLTIAPIMDRLAFECITFGAEKKSIKPSDTISLNDTLDRIIVPISVELGRKSYTLAEIRAIKEGTILELDKLAGENFDIFAGGELIGHGEVVVIDETFGIRVTDIGRKTDVQPQTS